MPFLPFFWGDFGIAKMVEGTMGQAGVPSRDSAIYLLRRVSLYDFNILKKSCSRLQCEFWSAPTWHLEIVDHLIWTSRPTPPWGRLHISRQRFAKTIHMGSRQGSSSGRSEPCWNFVKVLISQRSQKSQNVANENSVKDMGSWHKAIFSSLMWSVARLMSGLWGWSSTRCLVWRRSGFEPSSLGIFQSSKANHRSFHSESHSNPQKKRPQRATAHVHLDTSW